MTLYEDAWRVIRAALDAALPDAAVARALERARLGSGRIVLIAIGKAAWQMANAAHVLLGPRISRGVVITKYGHAKGELPRTDVYEAGHPTPDAAGVRAADEAIHAVRGLRADDTVLFLVSGGGSALFEKPLVPLAELEDVTRQLLACGADIVEINTVRKRLSAVKAGRFAELAAPARVFSIVLSDILGDPLDMVASGPAFPDPSTCAQAAHIVRKYGLRVSEAAQALLARETPKRLENATSEIAGSVSRLCAAARDECLRLGYAPHILTDSLCCTARDAGIFLASIARYHSGASRSLAYIAGGETVVEVKGGGTGGRNQEIALAAAEGITGLADVAVFSAGSDGTDGPTDAAGGYVDGGTARILAGQGIDIQAHLRDNDAYPALDAAGGLIKTGPTGTNVNDISVVLIRR